MLSIHLDPIDDEVCTVCDAHACKCDRCDHCQCLIQAEEGHEPWWSDPYRAPCLCDRDEHGSVVIVAADPDAEVPF